MLSSSRDLAAAGGSSRPRRSRLAAIFVGLVFGAIIPAAVVEYSVNRSGPLAEVYYFSWPNEPELGRFFADTIGLRVGERFRGSINFPTVDRDTGFTMVQLWADAIPTANEYSQLVTPHALYFIHALLKVDVRGQLNRFQPYWWDGSDSEVYWKAMQMFGVRYSAERTRLPDRFNPGYALMTLPHRSPSQDRPPGVWYVYELPHPNVGDYSPTEVMIAGSGAEIMAMLDRPDFDVTKQVVLSAAIGQPLVRARDMRLSVIRGGLHLSGKSDGTSLVVLPQQFSHCLRARDVRVHLVRANLMMAGVIFSGDLDTDIVFDYGIFSPACRWTDLADLKRLQLRIDLRMPHLSENRLFPDWGAAWGRLQTAVSGIR